MDEQHQTKVGIGVLIFKEGKVLLCKRKGSHGSGEYAFPGGHLEYMESFTECALARRAKNVASRSTIYDSNFWPTSKSMLPSITLTSAWWRIGRPESRRCWSRRNAKAG